MPFVAVRGALPHALSKPRSLRKRSEAQSLEIFSNQGRLQPEDYWNESKGLATLLTMQPASAR